MVREAINIFGANIQINFCLFSFINQENYFEPSNNTPAVEVKNTIGENHADIFGFILTYIYITSYILLIIHVITCI